MSHTRLNLPYVFFGLGRINNYIENFNMGIQKQGDWSYSWSPIIPNSQLFVSPISKDTAKWKIEIFINPTKALALIILSTIIVLVVLGMVIIYYHRKEKIEDNPGDTGYGIF
jgi:integrin alpha FG-GAP repeat containing protein 1